MNAPRRGLGRGLGALIPTGPATSPTNGEVTPGSDTPPPPAGHIELASKMAPAADREDDLDHASQRSADSPRSAGNGQPIGNTPPSEEAFRAEQGHAASSQPPGAYFAEVKIDSITPNPRQPRRAFDEESMAELVHSISEVGLLQPIVVREASAGNFELVMGERRWRASQQAGLSEIPAIVRETADHDLLRDALLENIHRAELNPLEEAAAYQQLLDDFGCTHEELATRIGRSRPQISNTLRLLRLSVPVQRRVAAGVLSAGHARVLLAVDDVQAQDALAARVVSEGMSVRTLEEQVAFGSEQRRQRAARRGNAASSAPGLVEIADRLSERLETRCKVELRPSKGKITVEFASLEDLERIANIIEHP